MSDIGNRSASMRLQCQRCGWPPPEGATMDAVLLHVQVEHDTDDVKLDLVAVCTCGAAMEHTGTRPTGGGVKDYVRCPACGNTGFVKREAA
jgi:DNA-directed RNA polymerase subunit RPC12/RpoP